MSLTIRESGHIVKTALAGHDLYQFGTVEKAALNKSDMCLGRIYILLKVPNASN